MKRYTITKVEKTNDSEIKLTVQKGRSFYIPNNRISRKLRSGDKLGIMYDRQLSEMPLVYLYKNRISLVNVTNAHLTSGLKKFVSGINWYDMPIFYVATIKRVIDNGKIPDLRAWVNVKTMLSHGFSR